MYVHGFNETFATAACTAAELCHFLGRVDVCAFFTWPASSGGNPLFSYTETTESVQYSVGQLQKVITHAVDLKWWVRIPTFSGWMEFDLKRYFQQS